MLPEVEETQATARPEPFRLGPWRIDPSLHRITSESGARKLEPRVMGVLVCLASEPGAPFSRQQLLEAAWSDVVVGDEALTMAISKLRRALGDDPRTPRFIETIPKKGYRLIPPVEVEPETADPASVPAASSPALPRSESLPAASAPFIESPWRARRPVILRALVGFGLFVLVIVSIHTWRERPPAPPQEPVIDSRLTSQPGAESQAEISPDGRYVAFIRHGPKAEPGIYTMELGGEAATLLSPGPVASPVWSPDGGRIAYADYSEEDVEIRIIAAQGGEPVTLATSEPCPMAGIDWSPDGRWIAVSQPTDDGLSCAAYAFDVETAESVQLTLPPVHNADSRPTYSPDGRYLAFSRGDSLFKHDLFIAPAGGGAPRRLTADGQRIWGFDWTAAGDGLVMASNRSGRYQLWRVPLDGGEPSWIPVPAENVRFPATTGQALVFDDFEIGAAIWRIEGGGEPVRYPGLGTNRRDSSPRHSPDGENLAFISNRSGTSEVWWVEGNEGPRRLTDLGASVVTGPEWSPDGRFLVIVALVGDGERLYLLDTRHGSTVEIEVPGNGRLSRPTFSADGTSVYVALGFSSDWKLWRAPIHGGAATAVVSDAYFARESVDGSMLYYVGVHAPGLWRRSVAGGDSTLVLDDLDLRVATSWSFEGDSIFYPRQGASGLELVRHRLGTGEVESLVTLPGDLLPSGISVSPLDGSILFSRSRAIESDLKLVAHFR